MRRHAGRMATHSGVRADKVSASGAVARHPPARNTAAVISADHWELSETPWHPLRFFSIGESPISSQGSQPAGRGIKVPENHAPGRHRPQAPAERLRQSGSLAGIVEPRRECRQVLKSRQSLYPACAA